MPNIIQQLKDANAEQNTAKILNLLPELFRAVDDGLIKVLPCKVGDTVFLLCCSKIYECEILEFTAYKHVITAKLYIRSDGRSTYSSIIDFGKTVFLTREAAEKALKESKHGN